MEELKKIVTSNGPARATGFVHYGDAAAKSGTKYWAMEAGLSEEDAEIVALADQWVDSKESGIGPYPKWFPFKSGNQSYHFNTNRGTEDDTMDDSRYQAAFRTFDLAFNFKQRKNRIEALRHLGIALHPLQDAPFHNTKVVKNFFGLFLFHMPWKWIDDYTARPECTAKAKAVTIAVVKGYIDQLWPHQVIENVQSIYRKR